MINLVSKPNLPDKTVTRVIAGKMPESVQNELLKCKIEVFKLENNPILPGGVSSHADLQCIHLGNNGILLEKTQQKLAQSLENIGFSVDFFSIKSGKYPNDCLVNAALIDNNVICKHDNIEEKLKDHIFKNSLNVINVNQGYSKCSVCVVDNNSVITEDESIKNACIKQGIDVLLIRKGYVSLPGFEYGFIGGASFKFNDNELAFIGKIENHPDYGKIKDFLDKKGINAVTFGDCELTDIGSVIPITE